MAREARAGSRRIRLYGVALVEQALVIELLKEPPKGFDILVVVGYVRVVKVYPIAHLLGQVAPLGRELHHVLTALTVVVLNRDVLV